MSSESISQKNPLAVERISKLIMKFAIPAIISMLVSSLYNIVDQIFIGQGVGMLGNAATNIAFPISIICTATALLLGIGSASNYNLESSLIRLIRSGAPGEGGADSRNRAVHVSNLRRIDWRWGAYTLRTAAACIWRDAGHPAICERLYRNYSIRYSVFDSDYRRKPYHTGGQEPDLFHDLYADRGDYQ